VVTPGEKELREVAAGVRARFRKAGEPARVATYAKYFREGYDAYGLPDGAVAAERDRLVAAHGDAWGLPGFLALGDLLVADGKYEEVFLAFALAEPFRGDFTRATLARFARWLDAGVANWAHCDVLCGNLLGPMLAGGVAPLAAFAPWRRAPSKWRRRAVPVTMLALLKAKPDVKAFLAFVAPLMTDEERVVHQGVGWFLREAWKVDAKPVEKFLMEWKDTAPRLIFQYATEKMTPAGKARFRAAKKSAKPGNRKTEAKKKPAKRTAAAKAAPRARKRRA
jgi:3-methyladenine DNA glycosylase AlkD